MYMYVNAYKVSYIRITIAITNTGSIESRCRIQLHFIISVYYL